MKRIERNDRVSRSGGSEGVGKSRTRGIESFRRPIEVRLNEFDSSFVVLDVKSPIYREYEYVGLS